MTKESDFLFLSSQARGRVELKLFCFPYAGGTSAIYKDWSQGLPASTQVVRVELPGRGARLRQPPFASMSPLIEVLTQEILPLLDAPFAFFGHSMGASIAFELARRLRRQHECEPQALFVSGCQAPQMPDPFPVIYNLPKDRFIEELKHIDGTPGEVLEHEELMELMMPLLRADFELTQTYQCLPDAPLQCPITAYRGLTDKVTRDMILPWREQTSSDFTLRMLPGDHFFLRTSQKQLLESLTQELHRVIVRHGLNNRKHFAADVDAMNTDHSG